MTKTIYISLDNEHSVDEVAAAFYKLLAGLTLDDIGLLTVSRITVIEHSGPRGHNVTRKAVRNAAQ